MKNNLFDIGIDIVNINYFNNVSENFIRRILTKKEYLEYLKLEDNYKIHFLSSRWAAKEAIYKAISKYEKINLIDIEVLNDINKKPFCSNLDNIFLSISHTDNYSIAIAIYNFL